MEKLKIKIERANAKLPEYATSGSSGMDLYACLETQVTIHPGEVALITTGIAIELYEGLECQIRSRSGLAIKNGVFALNSPGTIDSDYRGEIRVILANFSKAPFIVKHGDRIAQMVVARYERIEWIKTENLSSTTRGEGGFGSTGI